MTDFFEDVLSFRHWLNQISWAEWNSVYTVSLDELFDQYTEQNVEPDSVLAQDLRCMGASLKKSLLYNWRLEQNPDLTRVVNAGWQKLCHDHHACYVVNEEYPDRVFVLFGNTGGDIPCSFFTRVVATRQMRQHLTMNSQHSIDPAPFFVPDMRLIPLEPKNYIALLPENLQPDKFALVIHARSFSWHQNGHPQQLRRHFEKTLEQRSEECWAIAKLCCLGFPISSYFMSQNPGEDMLAIITDERSCVVLNDADTIPDQYKRTREMGQPHLMSRRHLAEQNLRSMILWVGTRKDPKTGCRETPEICQTHCGKQSFPYRREVRPPFCLLQKRSFCQGGKTFRQILKVALHELETMESQSGRTFRFLKASSLYDKPHAEQAKALWWIKPQAQ